MASRAQHYLWADRALAKLMELDPDVTPGEVALMALVRAVLATVDQDVVNRAAALADSPLAAQEPEDE